MNATTERQASRNRPVTQKQIAVHLGVSQSLVALALNHHPSISETTRLRVETAARELGYDRHNNTAARALAAQRYGTAIRTGQIAVLMGDFLEGHPLQDLPFFQEILQGIHAEAADEGLDVAIHVLRPGNLPRSVTQGGVDGAISVYSRTISNDLAAQDIQLPLVRLAGYAPEHFAIYPDDRQGIFETTTHLLEMGHRKIAFVGGFNNPNDVGMQALRVRGFRDAFAAAGLPPDEDLVYGHLPMPGIAEGLKAFQLLRSQGKPFTAVVCAHDIIALGVLEGAAQAGLRVPEDLSVTGFDGTTGTGYGGSATLTTVYFDRVAMGRLAVRMLHEIASDPTLSPEHRKMPVRLLARETSAPPEPEN